MLSDIVERIANGFVFLSAIVLVGVSIVGSIVVLDTLFTTGTLPNPIWLSGAVLGGSLSVVCYWLGWMIDA